MLNNKKPQINYHLVTLTIATTILIYVGIRAAHLSITHDEAFTYTRYVHHTYVEIINYETGNVLPNNHVLNTIAQKFFTELFGTSEFILRLGNLIACIVFLLVAYLFSRNFTGINMLSSFVILTLHPYVLDFMGLSRGYGMAFAFMLMSLYFLWRSIADDFNPMKSALGFLAAVVAIWANFSLLNYFMIIGPLFLLMQIINAGNHTGNTKWRDIIFVIGTVMLSALLLSLSIYHPLKFIIEHKQLFGGSQGFWTDTAISLCDRMAYGAQYAKIWISFLQVLILAVLIGAIAQIVYVLHTRRPNANDIFLIFLALLIIGMALASIMEFHFMGSFYPRERLALSFLPPFLVLILFLFKSLLSNYENEHPGLIYVHAALAVIFILHMLNAANLTYVLDWKYDANTKEIAQDIEAIEGDLLLGPHPFFEPALNFYRETRHLTKFLELDHDGYRNRGEYDYFVIPEEDKQKINDENLMIIKQYRPSLAMLAKRIN